MTDEPDRDDDWEYIKSQLRQLSPWQRRRFVWFLHWLLIKQQITEIPTKWVVFQIKLEAKLKETKFR